MKQHPGADLGRRAFLATLRLVIILGALIFLPAATLHYWQGWLLWLNVSGWSAALTFYLLIRDPALLERRLRAGPQAEREPAQKRILAFVSIVLLLFFLVAGLDHAFGWSRMPAFLVLLGNLMIAAGFLAVMLVLRQNSFASAIIEVSDGQKVISTGPYAVVRHPMYAGALAIFLGASLALGTWWGLLTMMPVLGGLAARLQDEERYLVRNLPGYEAYRHDVPYRLVPGVW
jgi:protein-S-isoprenylcysteine O-methyltransferase Ste14